jgi:hypothetical protein
MKVLHASTSINSEILVTTAKCGSKKGYLSIIKHGIKVVELNAISYQAPNGIWCLKKKQLD